jgi:hypothetical protein
MEKYIKTICLALIILFYLTVDYLFADGVSSLFLFGTMPAVLAAANIAIGTFEAVIFSKIFNIKLGKSILPLISANIVSALAGWAITLFSAFHGIDIYGRNKLVYGGLIALLFLSTVLIEWPFCFMILKENGKKAKAIIASLIVNACSYSAIIIISATIYLISHK